MKIRMTFSECEHGGDLAMYESAVRRLGGEVVATGMVDDDYETGYVVADVLWGGVRSFVRKVRTDEEIGGFVGSIQKVLE